MSSLIIKNGCLFDPLNGIDGEVKDIFIRDGRVVTDLSGTQRRGAQVIDAAKKTVMPGGVDSHSHVAGAKVNAGRLMRPEDHIRTVRARTAITHGGSGYTIPSVYKQGYDYAGMGYTTVFEAAMPPLEARHTHEEMGATPVLDMGAYMVLGNNWFVMRYLKDGDIDRTAAYIAWMMRTHKAYGIKCVNPAGVENWGWAKNVNSLDEPNIHFDITPREVIRGLAEANELLGLPMSLHLHTNNLGHPGNWEITRESLKITAGLAPSSRAQVPWAETRLDSRRQQTVYLAHAQFCSFGGTSWRDFQSGAQGVIDYVNSAEHVVIDNGAVPFGPATAMTGDGPAIHDLYMLSGQKWSNTDVELECGSGVIPFVYAKSSPISSIQWAMGLELLLRIKDPWKTIMTTDHPNGGVFTEYPQVMTWLMSRKARDQTASECHKWAYDRSSLGEVDREMDLFEMAVLTRANPARTIGISFRKGHLGAGADGDVTIYDIDPSTLDPAHHQNLASALARPYCTIKDGAVIARRGEVLAVPEGRRFYCQPFSDQEEEKEMLSDLKEWFKYYTVGFANYPVPDKYLKRPAPIAVNRPLEALARRR
ncbi:MAG: phenylhydantoinase [Methanosaeta sp. PtaB.Bin039]|nr:MAG: phenylhydantoinase [Methanosaeta sp. PtaB.Bin039]OPY44356.1 MAG: phenylhydantoinase [Methanosaeta sp. PtaU1.Bin028]HOT06220.1 formylmethanofuran dehydrogenase subunit A [Methanotrichaceae archaeon]HQF15470.1 formylmethanofuran dehydrogenase subunit A [Methanotrichaceae archaeon]HQI90205.1 formylmethanofuran dehydrogenase subunit A [Methanotrichaceae archaeon]